MQNKTYRNSHKSFPVIICSLAALFYVYDYFIQVSPAVMTQQLMAAFHIGATGLGILGSIFFYAYAGMQIPAGMLLDKHGARKTLTLAIFISGMGVLLFGMTHTFVFAGFSRFLVGFGSAFSFIGTLFLIAKWFKHRHFAFIAGIVQFAGCLGSIFGEAPLAYAVNHYGWRQVLIVIGLATFFISLIFWIIIRDKPKAKITSQQPINQKKSNTSKSNFVLLQPSILWIAIVGFLCWVPVASIGALWGVPYLMQAYHWTNTQAAGFCSIFWLSLGIGSPFMGWLSDKIQCRKIPCYICFSCGFIGSVLLIFAASLPIYVTGFSLILLGLGPAIQSLTFGIAKDILPDHIFGTASGLINMAAILGGGLSQVVIGFILSDLWIGTMPKGVPSYSLYNYQMAILIIPIGLLLGLIVTYIKLPETYCKMNDLS